MTRAIATTAVACLAGGAVMALASGSAAGIETLELLAAVSTGALMLALVARRARIRLGPLHRQLAISVGAAIAAILAAVGLAAGVMFISSEDALVVAVMAGVIAVVGSTIAKLLTDPVVDDIERLGRRLRAVGAGDRRPDIQTHGADELAGLATAANAMIDRLREEEAARGASEDARRNLVIAISHDLRTPLTALRVLTEAVEDRIVSGPTRRRYLKEMQTHVAVLSGLIEDLFELSRAQAGELATETRSVEIGELVSETVAAMRPAGDGKGVMLLAEPAAGRSAMTSLEARADPEQIRRVLMNLLDNAIRHTPAGGSVVARVSRCDGRVEVEVADEGEGIAEEDREQVFEAFHRGADNGARTGPGTGLGLAIARAIVAAHGGEIWIAPAQRGARVCFALPAVAERASALSSAPVQFGA